MEVNGHPLVCPHCKGESFTAAKAQLNTKWMTFFDLDFLNKEASTYICNDCGRVEWFVVAKQVDTDFVKWLNQNPEIKKRDEVDQIALYRDYQKRTNS